MISSIKEIILCLLQKLNILLISCFLIILDCIHMITFAHPIVILFFINFKNLSCNLIFDSINVNRFINI